jgi:hypothetical protein
MLEMRNKSLMHILEKDISLQAWSLMVAWAIKADNRHRLRELTIYGLKMGYVEAVRLTDRMVEELLDADASDDLNDKVISINRH